MGPKMGNTLALGVFDIPISIRGFGSRRENQSLSGVASLPEGALLGLSMGLRRATQGW